MGNCQSGSGAVEQTQTASKTPDSAPRDTKKAHHHPDGECTDSNSSTQSPRANTDVKIPVATTASTRRQDTNSSGGSGSKDARKNRWHDKPGYSSGASSDWDASLSDRDRGSDPLRLESMRHILHANGDLAQGIVRLETPFGKPIEEIYEGVNDGPVLGEGVMGIVRLIKHRATGVQYACKILDIGLIETEQGLRQLRDEISIMCQLDHPNIVRIEEVYESTNSIYLVQELCVGGDLFDRLDLQPDFHYTEAQCAKLVKQMLSAVRYLHSKAIIHRDLKLENFLFSSAEADSELMMIDFGLSKHFDLGEVHHEQVGTPYTCAPEILKGSYTEKSDVWALGVITYLLLSGDPPFGGCYDNENLCEVRNNIMNGHYAFEPTEIWDNVSDMSKAFVRKLLNVDPAKRPTARAVQKEAWLQIWGKQKDPGEGLRLNPKTVESLVRFKEYSDMRRLLHEVLSFTLLPEQIVELKEEFGKMDLTGEGQISLESMKHVLIYTAGAGALGGLTEAEVEDLFNALKVRKSDTTIRWHEFIAAGLSQCKVDDRNLQLAFDRLDSDRKGYISFNDLTDLLGSSDDTVTSLKKMWSESMSQCKCEHGRIYYEDFKFLMKGQKRDSIRRPSLVWGGASQSLALSEITEDMVEEESSEDSYDSAGHSKRLPGVKRKRFANQRSKSFDDSHHSRSKIWFIDEEKGRRQDRRASLPPKLCPVATPTGEVVRVIANDAQTPLVVNRAEYRKHRDLRIAVCDASKSFDMKCQARKAEAAGQQLGSPMKGAALIMKRGDLTPSHLEDMHTKALFDSAVRRCGRRQSLVAGPSHTERRRRKKTVSDMTGMMAVPITAL